MGIDATMFVRTRVELSSSTVRRLSAELCEAFGREPFFLQPDWTPREWSREIPDDAPGLHALSRITLYTQDGDDIVPDEGEQFIEVHLGGRYYGEDYARGDLPTYIAVARWLEARIPDAAIWYGGDSSGVCAEPFDDALRDRLWLHFVRVGHQPYRGSFNSEGGWRFVSGGLPLICDFCRVPFHGVGGGRGHEFFRCGSCGANAVRSQDGRIRTADHRSDLGALSRELDSMP